MNQMIQNVPIDVRMSKLNGSNELIECETKICEKKIFFGSFRFIISHSLILFELVMVDFRVPLTIW